MLPRIEQLVLTQFSPLRDEALRPRREPTTQKIDSLVAAAREQGRPVVFSSEVQLEAASHYRLRFSSAAQSPAALHVIFFDETVEPWDILAGMLNALYYF